MNNLTTVAQQKPLFFVSLSSTKLSEERIAPREETDKQNIWSLTNHREVMRCISPLGSLKRLLSSATHSSAGQEERPRLKDEATRLKTPSLHLLYKNQKPRSTFHNLPLLQRHINRCMSYTWLCSQLRKAWKGLANPRHFHSSITALYWDQPPSLNVNSYGGC